MPKAKAVSESDRAKAFALFASNESTNKVADQLFDGNWTKAKKLRTEWEEAQGEASEPGDDDDGDDAGVWDLTVQLSTERMDAVLADLTPAEKACAVTAVLQSRFGAEG